ncbi:TolC family protein [Fulvivirga sp. RKSG066]|uniref:TolC family protein n=1 Tax=Fulvivirga aurantia TaxID=2529383 RepID=UPI0012BCA47B|nr:TolC family protein [Fulvivirga aurantia]MTI22102.1 TolC family protein [Fulvivirga aurantia]
MKKLLIIPILMLFGSVGYTQTLEQYFEIAAKQNPGLQANYKDFEAAIQKVEQVSALPDPNFSFGYFISPVETRVGPQQARFSLSQMFPWFGTLKAQGDAATLIAEAKYQAFLDARNKLFYQIAAAYYPLYELNRWIAIEKENVALLESYKAIANKKFENGQGPMVDVLRVDIMLKDAQTNLEILTKKEKPLLATFNNLLNRDETEAVEVADTLVTSTLAEGHRRDSLLIQNPALEELELRIKASEASEEAATKQGLPKIGLGVDYVLVGERTDLPAGQAGMPDNGQNALMPMVSVSIPLFRSKYKAAIKEAQLNQESYRLQKEDYSNTLASNYEMAWFEITRQQELLQLYASQVEETQQALNLLFTAYGNSGNEFEEVLRMQQQLLKYEKMQATAEMEYELAVARLNYLTAKKY